MGASKKKSGKKEQKKPQLSLEEIDQKINHLKLMEVPVKELKKAAANYKRSVKKGSNGSDEKLEEVAKLIQNGWDAWKDLRMGFEISLMDMALDELEEKDEPVKLMEKELKKIMGLKGKKENKLKRSEKFHRDILQKMEKYPDRLYPETYAALNRSLDSFEEITASGADITVHKKYFKKLKNLFKKKDLKNILVYSNLLYTSSQSDLAEDLSKDRFKQIQDEVSSLMKTMDEFKKFGLENKSLEKELKKLQKDLAPSKFNEVQSTLNRLNKNISRTEKEFFRRKAEVSLIDSGDLIQEFGSIIDLNDQDKRLEAIRKEVRTTPPRKFMEESLEVENEIKDILFNNFEGEVQQRLTLIDKDLETSEYLADPERKKIVDLKNSVNSALENRNITEAMEYLSLAESLFGQADSEVSFVSVRSRYMDLLGNIEEIFKEDPEKEELKIELDEIEKLFLLDDIKAENIALEVDKAEGLISSRMIEIREKEFEDERTSIMSMLDRIDMKEEKKSSILNELDSLGSSIPDLNERSYNKRLSNIRKDFDQEISSYFRDNYNQWVGSIQETLNNYEIDDELSTDIQQSMEEAGRLYRERDYLNSGNLLCGISDRIEEFEQSRELEEAESLINSAEFMFQEASRAGVNVEDQTRLLSQAKQMLGSGDVAGSKDLASLIETNIKTKWMENKKSHLREDLNGLKDYYTETTNLGLDIEDASSILDEAESYFEKEMYDQVNDMVYEARETIEQKRRDFFSAGTMDTISDLKMEIDQLKELGISTVEAETMLIEAERLFMDEEYERSYSMTLDIKEQLNFSQDSYMKEEVPKKLDGLVKKVGKLEMMGLDTEAARSYLEESEKSREGGDLLKTMDNLSKVDDISSEIYRSHISLTIPETIVDVQKQIDFAREEGLFLDDISGLLKEAEDMFNKEDYDHALETIEKVQTDFDTRKQDFYKNKYIENMDLVEQMMDSAKGLDQEKDLSRDNMNMARDAFDRGDFEISNKLMEKVLKYIERSMDDKEETKRREIVQTYYDEVKTLLSVAEAENIDTKEERNMFTMAGDLMVKNEFDQAEHVLEGIKLGINDKRMAMKKRLIESSIHTTEILLDNMKNAGIDTSYERSLIEQLKEALRRGDLDTCDVINQRLQQSLHKNQAPFMLQSIERELAEFRGRIVDANSRGIDTSRIKGSLSKAIDYFEMGNVENSRSEIERGKKRLDDEERKYLEEVYQKTLNDLHENLSRLQKLGIPTDDEEQLTAIAMASHDDGKIADGTAYLETAIIGSKAKLNSYQATTAEGYLHQIEGYLEELKTNDIDVEDLKKIYEEGLELHEKGMDEKAVEKFSSILELGEEVRVQKFAEDLRERMEQQDSLYKDLRSVGMRKNSKLEMTLENSRKMVQKESFDVDKIKPLVEKIENLMKKKSEPFMEKLVKKHISDASYELKELEEAEGPKEELRGMIREAAQSLRSGDLDSADSKAIEVIDAVHRSRMKELSGILKEELSSVRQMLTRLKTLGSNVTNAEKLLSRAESALMDGKIENAEKLVKNVRVSIKDIVRRNMRETSLETIEFVDAMIHYLIDNFAGVSSKLGPAENKLDEARNLFMEKKFKAAKNTGEEARKLVEDLDIANIKQFFYVFQSSQATEMSRNVEIGIAELKKKGIDISKVKMLYDKAQEHFEKDDFDRGRQMITLSRIMLAEIDQQSMRDKAFDELNNAHVAILTHKRKGGKVKNAYNIYNNAKEAFSMREYKKAILLSKKAAYQAKKS